MHAVIWLLLSPFNFHYYLCKLLTQPPSPSSSHVVHYILTAVQQLMATGFILLMFHPTFTIALDMVLR